MRRLLFLLLLPLLVSGCIDERIIQPVFVDPTPVPGPYVPPEPVEPLPPPLDPPPGPEPEFGPVAEVLKNLEERYQTETITEADVTASAGEPWRKVPSYVDGTVAWLYRVQVNGQPRDAELKFRRGRLVSVLVGW